MNTDDKYTTRLRWLAIAAIAFAVSLVFFLYSLTLKPNPIRITNASSTKIEMLSNKELSIVRDALAQLVGSKSGTVDMSIRWSSFVKQNDSYKYFLVDMDSLKQTYRVSLYGSEVAMVSCPDISQSKYQDSFCSVPGLDGENTTSKVFGNALPYQSTVEGIEYRVQQRGNGSNLTVHIYDCPNDDVLSKVKSAVAELAKSYEVSIEIFDLQYEFNNCD